MAMGVVWVGGGVEAGVVGLLAETNTSWGIICWIRVFAGSAGTVVGWDLLKYAGGGAFEGWGSLGWWWCSSWQVEIGIALKLGPYC